MHLVRLPNVWLWPPVLFMLPEEASLQCCIGGSTAGTGVWLNRLLGSRGMDCLRGPDSGGLPDVSLWFAGRLKACETRFAMDSMSW